MKLSQSFIKTNKTAPSDEVARNAQLLIRAGYVFKVMAGVYAYTPLGLRVIEKIKRVVREEMDGIGGQEILMSSLQKKSTWDQTGRWDDETVDIWFKSELKDGTPVGFGWSHEEAVIEMMKQYISSYKDLPSAVYQFQTKLRNELRAKSGVMRGREFVMKDMYSFARDAEQHERFYNSVIDAYLRIYDKLGLGDDTFVTFASGGAFTQFSHEFQTVCEAGEDTIYLHRGKKVAVNEEVMDEQTLSRLGVRREEMVPVKSAEVGNIFNFGTLKSEQMDFGFNDADGQRRFIHLGSYGIGITRLLGVIAEKFSDDKGLVWPGRVAPYSIHLVGLGDNGISQANRLYGELTGRGLDVIFDDRDERAGVKFADADLMGMPWRITASDRLEGKFELKPRTSLEFETLTKEELFAKINQSDFNNK